MTCVLNRLASFISFALSFKFIEFFQVLLKIVEKCSKYTGSLLNKRFEIISPLIIFSVVDAKYLSLITKLIDGLSKVCFIFIPCLENKLTRSTSLLSLIDVTHLIPSCFPALYARRIFILMSRKCS